MDLSFGGKIANPEEFLIGFYGLILWIRVYGQRGEFRFRFGIFVDLFDGLFEEENDDEFWIFLNWWMNSLLKRGEKIMVKNYEPCRIYESPLNGF